MPSSVPASDRQDWERVKRERKNVLNDGENDSLILQPPPVIVGDDPIVHKLVFRGPRIVEVAHKNVFKWHDDCGRRQRKAYVVELGEERA